MKHFFFLFLVAILHCNANLDAQSISGNVNNSRNNLRLDFANVEIFQNNELIASLITDEKGNYDIQLDSGTYVVNIMYSGFHNETHEIHVTKDEVKNIFLNENEAEEEKKRQREVIEVLEISKAKTEERIESVMNLSYTDHSDDISYDSNKSYDYMPEARVPELKLISDSDSKADDFGLYSDGFISESKEKNQENVYAYGLTAGEINDFSKWDLWTDLTQGDLMYYQKTWKFSPKGRFMVSVMNKEKFPVVNVNVDLLDKNDKVIFSSKTDNTGKAELWENLRFPIDSLSNEAAKIKVNYGDFTKTLKNITSFSEGVNHIIIPADCEQSKLVDIAFVVDATASMQDEIDYLKLDINKVIYEAKRNAPELQLNFASVFYRDHQCEYMTKKQDFTKVLSQSAAFIERQNAAEGGDQPEALELALEEAIKNLTWREEARTKLMFLVLDAPCHNNSKIQSKLRRLCKIAALKGIKIIPITGSGINKSAEYLMRSLALTTNGTYVFLTDHSGIGEGHIDPSTDEYDVEILNVLLQRLISSNMYMPSCKDETHDNELFVDISLDSITYEIPKDSLNVPLDSLELNIPVNTEFPDEISWNYYPNPTYGPITIEVSQGVDFLYLTDMHGKLLKEIRMNGNLTLQTDISGFPMGTYFLRYPVGKKWLTGKVILMN